MTTEPPAPTQPNDVQKSAASGRWAFFRQSGWMVIATVGGGLFMTAVHTVAGKKMLPDEYSAFYALLRFFIWMGIPAAGLQNVFAQQSAAAFTDEKEHQLAGATRAILRAMFIFWLATSVLIFFGSREIVSVLQGWKSSGVVVGGCARLNNALGSDIQRVAARKTSFRGFGWLQIIDGVGRFAAVAVLLLAFGGQAASGMAGCVSGQIATLALGFWLTRGIWTSKGAPFQWRPWLARVVPLTFGLGRCCLSPPPMRCLCKARFRAETRQLYMGANLTGFAVMQFVSPIAMVMFPRVVRSVAKSETTDAMRLTVLLTGGVGVMAALVCTVMPTLPLHIIYASSPKMFGRRAIGAVVCVGVVAVDVEQCAC